MSAFRIGAGIVFLVVVGFAIWFFFLRKRKSSGSTTIIDPCAGLTDTSLASSVPVACLRKLLKDEGCNETGTVWPQDDYNGWWRQSPQGTTTVGCDNQGTPCGAGNFATVKSDIHAWATLTDADHVRGCKGPSAA